MLYTDNGSDTGGKQMKKTLMGLIMLLMLAGLVSAGSFKIQHPQGTDIFTVNQSGYVNASGSIYENNVLLADTYWAIADVATPNDGDATHLSTADQIFDYIVSLNYVANAWDDLTDMVLADGSIYIGNAATDPVANAITGDMTLSNTGVVSVVSTAGLMIGNITGGASYWNESSDLDDDELVEGKIAFSTACAAGEYYRLTGNDLECTTPNSGIDMATVDSQGFYNKTKINTTQLQEQTDNKLGILWSWLSARINEVEIPESQITDYGANSSTEMDVFFVTPAEMEIETGNHSAYWRTNNVTMTTYVDGKSGIGNVVEDLTPQLGGHLDLNNKVVMDASGVGNVSITSEGVIIVI